MKLYYIVRDDSSRPIAISTCYKTKSAVDARMDRIYDHWNYDIDSIDIDLKDKYQVYYVHLYKGFDYGWSTGSVKDVIVTSKPYATVEECKEDPLWISIKECAENSPELFHVDENGRFIASDSNGEPWRFGDAMEGKIFIQIREMAVWHGSE
ncbi:MAG: hypothetical protein IKA36_07060 [Clostridia bacterium]|nr:hypothetical protein [Clostridia bacterium]